MKLFDKKFLMIIATEILLSAVLFFVSFPGGCGNEAGFLNPFGFPTGGVCDLMMRYQQPGLPFYVMADITILTAIIYIILKLKNRNS